MNHQNLETQRPLRTAAEIAENTGELTAGVL